MTFFHSQLTAIVSWTILVLSLHAGPRFTLGFELGTPADEVVALKVENYHQALQDPANSLWFLKFYAPWCGAFLQNE
jgi:hypothetical protein